MTIRGKFLLGGGIIGFCLLASGCLANDSTLPPAESGAPGPSESAASTTTTALIGDACTLVTAVEAAGALGENVRYAESSSAIDGLGQKSCVYKSATAGSKRMVEVRVVQTSSISSAERKKGATAATEFEKARASFAKRPEGATPIPNAGDNAFWNGTRLYVLKQDVLLTLLVGDESAGNVGSTTPLAKSAVKRISPLSGR